MTKEILYFENGIIMCCHEDFGGIRMKVIDDEPLFLGQDVANSLKYVSPGAAVLKYCNTSGCQRYKPTNEFWLDVDEVAELCYNSGSSKRRDFLKWIYEDILEELGYEKRQVDNKKFLPVKNSDNSLFEQKERTKEYGGLVFFQSSSKNIDVLKKYDYAFFSRIICLSTYLDFYSQDLYLRKGRVLKERDLGKVLKLDYQETRHFKQDAIECGLIECKKDGILINRDFYRGATVIGDRGIYIQPFRNLWEEMTPRQHKACGKVFSLLPLMNEYWNVVCRNPKEKNPEYIDALSVGEICEIVGYDKLKLKQFKGTLSGLRFQWAGKEQTLCSFSRVNDSCRKDALTVNPHIIMPKADIEDVIELGGGFEV